MRTYGKVNGVWTEVSTDANGFNDAVYLTTLCQVLNGTPGESPFYAQYGIPGRQSVLTRVAPDFYAARTQSQFQGFFSSLTIARTQGATQPTYAVNAVPNQGAILPTVIPR